ncbi:MAG: hypothetical protein QM703_18960 [Gemmatales bacterium]
MSRESWFLLEFGAQFVLTLVDIYGYEAGMNARFWIIMLIAATCCGCSEFICNSGLDLHSFQGQSAIRSQFGQPLDSGKHIGEPENGLTYDEFVTHQKLAHNQGMYGMAVAMTFGLCEVFAFPWQAMVAGQNVIFGRRIRYIYDQDGKVVQVLEEGERYNGPFRLHSSSE